MTRQSQTTHVEPGAQATDKSDDRDTTWETIELEAGRLVEEAKRIIEEGTARRIVVKQGHQTVVELPLALGVVGTLVAAPLAALGALAALLNDCTIEVERERPGSGNGRGTRVSAKRGGVRSGTHAARPGGRATTSTAKSAPRAASATKRRATPRTRARSQGM